MGFFNRVPRVPFKGYNRAPKEAILTAKTYETLLFYILLGSRWTCFRLFVLLRSPGFWGSFGFQRRAFGASA